MNLSPKGVIQRHVMRYRKRRMVYTVRSILILAILICLPGCTTTRTDLPPAERLRAFEDITIKTELIFGLQRASGDTIALAEWKDFLDREISTRFKDGLTVIDAHGQYLGTTGRMYKEPSRIVVLLHQASDSVDALIDTVRSVYKRRFQQESVLRISTPVGVSF